jgi:hypothetical protein
VLSPLGVALIGVAAGQVSLSPINNFQRTNGLEKT